MRFRKLPSSGLGNQRAMKSSSSGTPMPLLASVKRIGTTWASSFAAEEGTNSILVRQTDVAGNVSAAAANYERLLEMDAGGRPVSLPDVHEARVTERHGERPIVAQVPGNRQALGQGGASRHQIPE